MKQDQERKDQADINLKSQNKKTRLPRVFLFFTLFDTIAKMKINFKKYGLYLLRWQLSTPVIAVVLIFLASMNKWVATAIANLIGGLIFFWIDRLIFASKKNIKCDIKEDIKCFKCGEITEGYYLVKTENCNNINDIRPKFICENCLKKK